MNRSLAEGQTESRHRGTCQGSRGNTSWGVGGQVNVVCGSWELWLLTDVFGKAVWVSQLGWVMIDGVTW